MWLRPMRSTPNIAASPPVTLMLVTVFWMVKSFGVAGVFTLTAPTYQDDGKTEIVGVDRDTQPEKAPT